MQVTVKQGWRVSRSDSAEVLRGSTMGKAKGVTRTGQVALLLGTLAQRWCPLFVCSVVGEPGAPRGVAHAQVRRPVGKQSSASH